MPAAGVGIRTASGEVAEFAHTGRGIENQLGALAMRVLGGEAQAVGVLIIIDRQCAPERLPCGGVSHLYCDFTGTYFLQFSGIHIQLSFRRAALCCTI